MLNGTLIRRGGRECLMSFRDKGHNKNKCTLLTWSLWRLSRLARSRFHQRYLYNLSLDKCEEHTNKVALVIPYKTRSKTQDKGAETKLYKFHVPRTCSFQRSATVHSRPRYSAAHHQEVSVTSLLVFYYKMAPGRTSGSPSLSSAL